MNSDSSVPGTVPKIPIPVGRRLFLMRARCLPGVVFLVTGLLVSALWREFAVPVTLQGVAHGEEVVVRSPRGGWVQDAPFWFDTVGIGDTLSWILPLDTESIGLQQGLAVAREQLEDAVQGPLLTIQRNLMDFESLNLELEETETRLAQDRVRLDFLKREGDRMARLWEDQVVTASEKEAIESEINQMAIAVSRGQFRARALRDSLSAVRLESPAGPDWDDIRGKLGQVRHWEQHILNRSAEPLAVKAPLAGVVTQQHVSAGSVVQPGDKLFTIETKTADRVVAYLPAESRWHPGVGAKVLVYRRSPGEAVEGTVVRVGPGVQALPDRFSPSGLGNGRRFIPLRILLDRAEDFLPGESLYVRILEAGS